MSELCILSKVVWDVADEKSTREAQHRFDELVSNSYIIYQMESATGAEGVKVKKFDPTAKRLLAIPQLKGG